MQVTKTILYEKGCAGEGEVDTGEDVAGEEVWIFALTFLGY